MTPLQRGPCSRILIPLLVAALGIAIGVGGVVALRPLESATTVRPSASPAAADRPASRPAATATAKPLSDSAIYARVEPSVVDVTATLRSADETASGTGFVIDPRAALVLTNNHVIRDATSVTVTIPATGKTYKARIVGTDAAADIAVLAITGAPGLVAAHLGDSAAVTLGSAVVAIGNRAGAGGAPALAPGVISGIDRTIHASDGASKFTETLHGLLATTARIEPGDSGGPLADASGAVVGVDTAAGTGGAVAGYAITINTAMAAERQILDNARGGPRNAARPALPASAARRQYLPAIRG